MSTAPAGDGAQLHGLKVGLFGGVDVTYARNRLLRRALEMQGAQVVDIVDRRGFARRAPALVRRGRRCQVDVMVVGFPAHIDVVLARLASWRRGIPVVWDPLALLYESWRDRVPAGGYQWRRRLAAVRYAAVDLVAGRMADVVVGDTEAHIQHMSRWLLRPRRRFARLWIGSDQASMVATPASARPPGEPLRVVGYFSFTPLHGVENVIRAARLLQDEGRRVSFLLIGVGPTRDGCLELVRSLGVTSVAFAGYRRYSSLPALLAESDVCLGVFGGTAKSRRVIPNKVFDGLCLGRPVLTADTPAAREVLVHGESAWLCREADPTDLAAAIGVLDDDAELRARLAAGARTLFDTRFAIDVQARDLAVIVKTALDQRRPRRGKA